MTTDKKSRTGLWALAIKLGTKLFSVFIKLLKGLKFTKVGLAGASFAGYAALMSWKFALLLMIAVGFHESGHVWAMKKMGIKTKGFYFLPFMGGAAIAEESYKTYGENSYIAIMGPIWGAFLAWVCGIIYYCTGNTLWAAAAAWMATLNIFNLLPIVPLDGGQIVRSIAFSINKGLGLVFLSVSMVAACLIMYHLKIGLFALILIVGGLDLIFEVHNRGKLKKFLHGDLSKYKLPRSMIDSDGEVRHYPQSMNVTQLILSAVAYVGTIAILVVLLFLMKHIPGADLAANFLE